MAKQIDVLADWAVSATVYGNTAIKPSAAKRQSGWTGGATPDVPPAPHVNWLHKTAYENIAWLVDNAYFSDVARWEYMPVSGTFPVTAAGTFFIGFGSGGLDPGTRFNHIAWNGASAFMVTGSSYVNSAGCTGFVVVSKDVGRSWTPIIPTALSGVRPSGITYDAINGRFVVATTVAANQHCALKYTTDLGTTWSTVEIVNTNVDSVKFLSWWPQAGRYVVGAFSNPVQTYVSASGAITGAYTQTSLTTSEFFSAANSNQPVMNNRYFMFLASVFSTGRTVVYYIPIGSGTTSRRLCDTTPLNNVGGAYLHYLPHNDTFVMSCSGSFLVLDGATGNPATVANWTSVVPAVTGNAMPGAAAFNAADWLQWDARRSLFYAHVPDYTGGIPSVNGIWTAPSLVGPWKQLPAYNGNATGLINVLGSNYLNGYFVEVQNYQFANAGAPDLNAGMQTIARRSFPPLY